MLKRASGRRSGAKECCQCRGLVRTIKEEKVWLNEYRKIDEARARLAAFFEFYNAERMHCALGYISPPQKAGLKWS